MTGAMRAAARLHAAIQTALDTLPGIEAEAGVAVAFSGGADSTALLHAATKVLGQRRLYAFHVNHQLSSNARAWQAHCASVAAALAVRYETADVHVAPDDPSGVEAAARAARYSALEELALRSSVRVILLAHHADDQAETVLLQALRGAGPAGLAAMPTRSRSASGVWLLRPGLALSRDQLRDALDCYLSQPGASPHLPRWIEDESNDDPRFARNALRRFIDTGLAERFPAYRSTLARVAQHAAEATSLLDALADIDLAAAGLRIDDSGLSQVSESALLALDDARLRNALRRWFRSTGLRAPATARLDALRRALRTGARGRLGCFDGHVLMRERDVLRWLPASELVPRALAPACSIAPGPAQSIRFSALDRGEWMLPAWGGRLRLTEIAAQITDCGGREAGDHATHRAETEISDSWPLAMLMNATLTVRARAGGERMRMRRDGPSRSLKNLFQEAGVPAVARAVPLFEIDGRLAFVPGVGIDRAYAAELARAALAQAGDAHRETRQCRMEWQFLPVGLSI